MAQLCPLSSQGSLTVDIDNKAEDILGHLEINTLKLETKTSRTDSQVLVTDSQVLVTDSQDLVTDPDPDSLYLALEIIGLHLHVVMVIHSLVEPDNLVQHTAL